MTDYLITSDGELAVPFEAPPIEHDPGFRLSSHWYTSYAEAMLLFFSFVMLAIVFAETYGAYLMLLSFVAVPIALLVKLTFITVYQKGMKIGLFLRQPQWLWWDEITEIDHLREERWMGGLDRIDNTYIELWLYIRNQLVFELPRNITNRLSLYHVIGLHVEMSLVSYYSHILPEGKVIAMGPIRVQHTGIHINDAFVRWEDIEALERDGDDFTLKTSAKTYRLTFTRNQNVLYRLFLNAMAGDIGADQNAVDRIEYRYYSNFAVARYRPPGRTGK
ncbi:MAG: hypothetical protein L0154_19900 [Chloroflexi bacterium]|nr:hypothetical protein [Chloroflexota bacterium]